MKTLYALATAVLIGAAGLFGIAMAHEEVDNGTASMLVHSTPSHTFVAGAPYMLYINLENKEKGFTVANCNCTLTVGQNEKPFLTTTLTGSNSGEFNTNPVAVTFRNDGRYDITVTGEPKTPGLFTSFITDYDTEVLPVGSPIPDDEGNLLAGAFHTHMDGMTPWQHAAHLVLMWGAIVVSVIVIIRERKGLFGKKK